ncbi:hypothetical protein ABFG93_01325 [Pseudalkalibacillus hwajinpoensis]|uniref:hypothetical protein n=1 Tax=Guptibacillus hwajinpoensis TaxID=208199 RepID=UPI00325B358E
MKNLPTMVQGCMEDYLFMFNEHLPNKLEGLYIHGSIALQAYVPGSSDIDFITILNRRCSEREKEILLMIHRAIEHKHNLLELDVGYIC